MRKACLCLGMVLFVLSTARPAGGQTPVSPDMPRASETHAEKPLRVDTIRKQLFFTTVRIEAETAKGIAAGTGFIYDYPQESGKPGISFVVTNRHLVEGTAHGRLFFVKSGTENPLLGEKYEYQIDAFGSHWFFHPDPKVDVAILPFGPVLNDMESKGRNIFYRSVDIKEVPSEEELSQLDAIEPVLFIGYPNGIFDKTSFLPIARSGQTATPVTMDYDGRPLFLIDASVFPGSSGSPVFVLKSDMYFKYGRTFRNERLFFLGLISSAAIKTDSGDLKFIDPLRHRVGFVRSKQFLDIGIVVKARAIAETAEAFIREKR